MLDVEGTNAISVLMELADILRKRTDCLPTMRPSWTLDPNVRASQESQSRFLKVECAILKRKSNTLDEVTAEVKKSHNQPSTGTG